MAGLAIVMAGWSGEGGKGDILECATIMGEREWDK